MTNTVIQQLVGNFNPLVVHIVRNLQLEWIPFIKNLDSESWMVW